MKVETEIDTTIDIMDTLGVILRLRDNNIKVYEIINEKEVLVSTFLLDENGEIQCEEKDGLNKQKYEDDISILWDIVNAIYLIQKEPEKFRLVFEQLNSSKKISRFTEDFITELHIFCNQKGNKGKIEIDELLKHIKEEYMKNEKYSDIVKKFREKINELSKAAHNIEGNNS